MTPWAHSSAWLISPTTQMVCYRSVLNWETPGNPHEILRSRIRPVFVPILRTIWAWDAHFPRRPSVPILIYDFFLFFPSSSGSSPKRVKTKNKKPSCGPHPVYSSPLHLVVVPSPLETPYLPILASAQCAPRLESDPHPDIKWKKWVSRAWHLREHHLFFFGRWGGEAKVCLVFVFSKQLKHIRPAIFVLYPEHQEMTFRYPARRSFCHWGVFSSQNVPLRW